MRVGQRMILNLGSLLVDRGCDMDVEALQAWVMGSDMVQVIRKGWLVVCRPMHYRYYLMQPLLISLTAYLVLWS
jgi:hypothetical protein